ncbi:MAG: L-histidine N(alpha)-methyltransferase [bacterium]
MARTDWTSGGEPLPAPDVRCPERFPGPRNRRLRILNHLDGRYREDMIRDIRRGLSQTPKSIPSKYFYDARGSELFERICTTPEYYPTRTELSILDRCALEIMQFFSRAAADLVELGSGSNLKIRRLLDALPFCERGRLRYVPVDISESSMVASATELLDDYPSLEVFGVLADFTCHVGALPGGALSDGALPSGALARTRKLITFLGGTIGNLEEDEAVRLLRSVGAIMGPEDRFLIGMDMIKPVETLEAAYNDSQGVTRDFNRNILNHVNRTLEADFDPEDFDHVAFFDRSRERIEMQLRAGRAVRATVAGIGMCVEIRKGETIHTEICKKFSQESASRLFRKAGLRIVRRFTDSRGWFSLFEVRTGGRQ